VLAALARRGAAAALLDLALMPRQGVVRLGHGGGGPSVLILPDGTLVEASQVRAAWWRRGLEPVVHDGLSYGAAHHARLQWEALLHGFLGGLAARLVNDPWLEARAARKPAQLAAAERAGLQVPETLVTSDPAAAAAFLDGLGEARAVAKPLDGTDPAGWTRLLGDEDRDRLAGLRTAPVILQRYVAGVDVRLTAVGDRLYACQIDARATPSPQDWRAAASEARFAPCDVPAEVVAGVLRLMAGLGLAYGALDFRVREADGAWHFLEVNPSGQWLGIEERTGLPITQAVAELLAGPPG
jgi:hypothetical protein